MKRKIRCEVCGTKFEPQIYTAEEPGGVVQALSGGKKKYDACDCPECGRQRILGERLDRTKGLVEEVGEALDKVMEEVDEALEEVNESEWEEGEPDDERTA